MFKLVLVLSLIIFTGALVFNYFKISRKLKNFRMPYTFGNK